MAKLSQLCFIGASKLPSKILDLTSNEFMSEEENLSLLAFPLIQTHFLISLSLSSFYYSLHYRCFLPPDCAIKFDCGSAIPLSLPSKLSNAHTFQMFIISEDLF